MWEQRNPNYEGFEAIFRYYLPENHHVVMFVLGLYGAIIAYNVMGGNAKARDAKKSIPAPVVPDFHTIKTRSAIPSAVDETEVSYSIICSFLKSLPRCTNV